METKTIARINDVSILIIDEGEKHVPIKPICEALGIDIDSQRKKLKEDEILSSTTVLNTVVAADGKQREMLCLPYMFVFGWLFTINPNKVAPEAKENVLKYKLECYKVLFSHFTNQTKFLEEKQIAIDKHIELAKELRESFNNARTNLSRARNMLDRIRKQTFDDWKGNNMQMKMIFAELEE